MNIYDNTYQIPDYELHIDSFEHVIGDPIPHIDFSKVFSLFKVDPEHPLVNIEKQIAHAQQEGKYPAINVYYLTVKNVLSTIYPDYINVNNGVI